MRTSLILFTASILALSSCQTTEMNNHEGGRLSSTDSLKIIEGVNEALDLYADANNTLDGERITGFWSQSSDLVFIVGNYEYTDWNSIYQACIDFYSSPIDSTNLEWISRNIVPLSRDCASVYGKYKMFLRIPSGEVIMNIAPYFTAVMVKEGEQWKVLRGHESYQQISKYPTYYYFNRSVNKKLLKPFHRYKKDNSDLSSKVYESLLNKLPS